MGQLSTIERPLGLGFGGRGGHDKPQPVSARPSASGGDQPAFDLFVFGGADEDA